MSRQFDDLKLGSIELFCMAATANSFTAAAMTAGLTPAAVSRAITRLEARLGTQLFVRTTRQLRLTDSGRNYFEQCQQALSQLIEAEREVTGEQRQPVGLVRISLPTSYGHYRILPLLPKFRQKFPGVQIDVQLNNRNIDFAAEGFDLAVRGRNPPDSGLIARRLEDAELVVVATPAYLRRHGTPTTPQALAGHECIQFLLPSTGQAIAWRLRMKGQEVDWPTQGSLRCIDDVLGALTLTRAGAGLVQTYRFIVADDLREGRLKEVLKPYGGTARPFSLLYPANRHMPLRVRVLIDFLMEKLGPTGR